MWQTCDGARRLKGAERLLVLEGSLGLIDEYLARHPLEQDRFPIGSPSWDPRPNDEKPWLLLLVVDALTNDQPPAELTAWAESAVYVIFEYIGQRLDAELEGYGIRCCFWRLLILQAYLQAYGGDREKTCRQDNGFREAVWSRDSEAWSLKLELLQDSILWDRDFLDSSLPRIGTIGDPSDRQHFGVLPGYYDAVPPVLNYSLKMRLRLLHSKWTNEVARARKLFPKLEPGR